MRLVSKIAKVLREGSEGAIRPLKANFKTLAESQKLTAKQRIKITSEFCKYPTLTGNDRRDSLSPALRDLRNALDACGYTLDMIPGDLLLGDNGNRRLTFRPSNRPEDNPFSEYPAIEDEVVFIWENLSSREKHFECIAYLS